MFLYSSYFSRNLYGQFGCPEKDASIVASVGCSAINMVSGLKLTIRNLHLLSFVYGAKKITFKTIDRLSSISMLFEKLFHRVQYKI